MFYVFFCLIAHSAFTVRWLLLDVLLKITCIEVLDIGLLLSNSVSPFMPELHNITQSKSNRENSIRILRETEEEVGQREHVLYASV